jgi:hypothetical protein
MRTLSLDEMTFGLEEGGEYHVQNSPTIRNLGKFLYYDLSNNWIGIQFTNAHWWIYDIRGGVYHDDHTLGKKFFMTED